MHITRRSFFTVATGFVAAAIAFVSGSLSAQRARARDWLVRRATAADAAVLRDIFNAQLRAGLCAYPDKIDPWTERKAKAFLRVYTGTILVARDGEPVGFVGYVDFAASDATSSIAPGVDPEIPVLAVNVDLLDPSERAYAAKALAASMARDFVRMGFAGCRALVSATSGFPPLPTRNAVVVKTHARDGVPYARDVRYDVKILDDLAGEGF